MPRIDLVEDGLIYSTTFTSLDDVWIISPDGTEFASIGEGTGLSLNPGASPDQMVLALYSQIEQPYVMDVELEYTPSLVADNAGLVLWANDDSAIYLSVVAGGNQYEKLRVRVVGERCEAYAFSSAVGSWETAGTALVSPDMLPGVYAEGQVPAVIKKAVIARDTSLVLGNIPDGYSAVLLDESGAVLERVPAVNGAAVIPLRQRGLIFSGRLQVQDQEENVLADTGLVAVSGGSVYWYNAHDLELYLDDTLIPPDQETELGMLVNRLIEKRLEIQNNEDAAVSGITVCCGNFNNHYSSQWVKLAPDVEGMPGMYSDSVFIEQLGPGERATCWLKIERPEGFSRLFCAEHRFALIITTES